MTKDTNTIREKILKGMKLTHKRLIQNKKERNQEIVISKNGKIIKLKASELT